MISFLARSMLLLSRKSSPLPRLALLCRHLSGITDPTGPAFIRHGSKFSPSYSQYATANDGNVISYFHDVPLAPDFKTNEVNMVLEIPRWSQAKFEILTSQRGNPITQDQKNGKVRFVKNLFPFHGYIHNYGALPQTWEDPTTRDKELGHCGDNDPLDVCEIGLAVPCTGDIFRVRVLGCLAMIDEGEVDWKIITIRVDDPLAQKIFTLDDVNRHCRGLLTCTRNWLRDYKLPDGKQQNTFGYNGEYKDASYAMKIIQECHANWGLLIRGQIRGNDLPAIENVTLEGTPGHCASLHIQVSGSKDLPDTPLPTGITKNFYF